MRIQTLLMTMAVVLLAGCTAAPSGTEQLPGRIYFQDQQAITMLEGGRQVRVTLPAGITIDAIAPDGRSFTGSDGSHTLLFRVDGDKVQQVAELDALTPAAWAPDGSKLAAATTDGRVRTFDAAGKLLRELPAVAPGAHLRFSWAPDGQRLAVETSDMMASHSELHLIQLADGAVIPLGKGMGSPAWSPDGQGLAYAYGAAEGGVAAVLVRGASESRSLLTEAMLRPTHPQVFERHQFVPYDAVWSPGGDRLLTTFKAYGSEHPVFGLVVSALDGSPPHVQILPVHPEHPANAKFSPPRPCTPDAQWAAQGERIVVKLSGFGCEGQFFIADGRTLKRLSDMAVDPAASLTVAPDGAWFALAGSDGTTRFHPVTGKQEPITVTGLGKLIHWSPAPAPAK